MRSLFSLLTLVLGVLSTALAQESGLLNSAPDTISGSELAHVQQQVVKITGVRFSYPLVQHWIDRFNEKYPDVQVIIESRGSSDPSQYDILVEAHEHPEEIRKNREYVYIARYAMLPIANRKSEFARTYSGKGLDQALIKQLFFHDIYADSEEQKEISAPFTIYTRLQKAGAAAVFSRYFGFTQNDIQGKAIAGSDEHLIKALVRDSTGVSYAPLSLIYDLKSREPVDGIVVLPVDINGNGKISDDEKFYDNLSNVITRMEQSASKELHNIPVGHIHLSVDRVAASEESLLFLQWVVDNAASDLHVFGYLSPDMENSKGSNRTD